jgi:ribosome biogenesis GTPase / thiamine phosphate phosphatase
MLVGTVLRSHAGGYLVCQNELGVDFQCAARGRLKKESVSIFTGDRVELDEVNLELSTAVISARLERENLLSRPPLANVDQIVIVQAIHQPEWNSLWCDRHLVHFQLEVAGASFVLCFNKSDLANDEEIDALRSIYEPLGYRVIICSARTGYGVSALAEALSGKISVFAGPSGVGKSSLLNDLLPELNLKVGRMTNEFGVGRHTTTASEIYRLSTSAANTVTWVADTPGFSLSELRHPEPSDVAWMFPEIIKLSEECRYSNCLHLVEQDCNILNNLAKISQERYQSYVLLVNEAQSEQKLRQDVSTKVEAKVKSVGGKAGRAKAIPRLNERYRAPSRRLEKQRLSQVETEGEDTAEVED